MPTTGNRVQILRTFRLSRIFRVLKVSQRMSRASLIADALTASSDVIIMLAFLLLLSMLIFSALVYETENSIMKTWDPLTGETVCLPLPPECYLRASLQQDCANCVVMGIAVLHLAHLEIPWC